jgi:gamma-glutamylcysteine synthetase
VSAVRRYEILKSFENRSQHAKTAMHLDGARWQIQLNECTGEALSRSNP